MTENKDDESIKDEKVNSTNEINYIAYPKAMQLLLDRLRAIPEEIAAWIMMGEDNGGLTAYLNANELNPPPRFFYTSNNYENEYGDNYLSPLNHCWFKTEDISNFRPIERFITGKMLIERWKNQPYIQPEAFIRAKISESRLFDYHPIMGHTRLETDDNYFPLMETALFAFSDIKKIEKEDLIEAAVECLSKSFPKTGKTTEKRSSNLKSKGSDSVAREKTNKSSNSIKVTDTCPEGIKKENKEALETNNWKMKVQSEAARRWINLRKAGANPTRFSIQNDLATWCRDNEVKTKTGINPSAEYIYRHALREWMPPVDSAK